jgi:hypothetical protein
MAKNLVNLVYVAKTISENYSPSDAEKILQKSRGSKERFLELLCESVCASSGLSGEARRDFEALFAELMEINPIALNTLFSSKEMGH